LAFSEIVKAVVRRRSGGMCECTRVEHSHPYGRCYAPCAEVHHLKPQIAGGDDSLGNAQDLCKECHDWVTYGYPSALEAALKRYFPR
jgi:hypothetical protein